jgi:hypothetical protein
VRVAIRLVLGVLEAVAMVQYFKATPLVELRTQVAEAGAHETLTMLAMLVPAAQASLLSKSPTRLLRHSLVV